MTFGALRRLATELNFNFAHGVPATVTRPSQSSVQAFGIWARPLLEDQPVGAEFSTREPRRVMALRREDFETIERGTIINAPEQMGGTAIDWQADGVEMTEGRYFLVKVIHRTGVN